MISQLDVRRWREVYQRCDDARDTDTTAREIADTINAAHVAATGAMVRHGYGVENADDAEALIGALTWFFFTSNPSFQAAVPPPLVLADEPDDDEPSEAPAKRDDPLETLATLYRDFTSPSTAELIRRGPHVALIARTLIENGVSLPTPDSRTEAELLDAADQRWTSQ